ncbi:MAG: hypothetical protein R6U96_05465 [Promethearchaeia archaeon]
MKSSKVKFLFQMSQQIKINLGRAPVDVSKEKHTTKFEEIENAFSRLEHLRFIEKKNGKYNFIGTGKNKSYTIDNYINIFLYILYNAMDFGCVHLDLSCQNRIT